MSEMNTEERFSVAHPTAYARRDDTIFDEYDAPKLRELSKKAQALEAEFAGMEFRSGKADRVLSKIEDGFGTIVRVIDEVLGE